MLAFTFAVCLTSILVALSPKVSLQRDAPGKVRTEQAQASTAKSYQPNSLNLTKKSDLSRREKPVKTPPKSEMHSSQDTRKLFFRVEPITKPAALKVEDSAYLMVPASSFREKKSVVWKLRLIFPDSSGRKARDYRLILDSPGNLLTEVITSKDSLISINAYLQPTNTDKEVPLTLTNAIRVNPPAANVPSLLPIPTTNSSFWQTLLFLGSGLAGIFCLLWATSRFLVFTVSVKPDSTVSFTAQKENNSDSKLSPLHVESNRLEEESLESAVSNQLQAEKLASEENLLSPAIEPQGESISRAYSYFSTEILLTAGPRKKYMSDPDADKDLGEDACGMVANHQQLLLWVLDGTSDQYCLRHPVNHREYFSSRLLAQGISGKLRSAFPQVATTSLDALLLQAVQAVKMDWLRQIRELPPDEQAILRTNIEQKNIPECATTLLIGALSINGELIAYRSGDCKMVLYQASANDQLKTLNTALASKNENSNDRLFFRLVLTPQGEFYIQHNTPKYEIIKQTKVQSVIAFSDGIGLESEALLNKPEGKSLITLREEIVYHLQGTADDKAICFIQIKSGKE